MGESISLLAQIKEELIQSGYIKRKFTKQKIKLNNKKDTTSWKC